MVEFETIERELELYDKGRMLRPLVISPAWEVIIQVLKDYKDAADDDLTDLAPGDPTVPYAHAAASALKDQFKKFQQDITNAVDFAANPSQDLIEYLNGARVSMDVLKQQENQFR